MFLHTVKPCVSESRLGDTAKRESDEEKSSGGPLQEEDGAPPSTPDDPSADAFEDLEDLEEALILTNGALNNFQAADSEPGAPAAVKSGEEVSK